MIRADVDTLSEEQIIDYIDKFDNSNYVDNNRYYKGDNPVVMDRVPPDNRSQSPDNKVPVSYARKIINTVAGYMFKPGLIHYSIDDKKYNDLITEVNELNVEPIKTSQIGKQVSIQGVGYELHYVTGIKTGDSKLPTKAVPRFTKISAEEIIPIYNYDLEPVLIIAIRVFDMGAKDKVEVYYPDRIEHYYRAKNKGRKEKTLERLEEQRHFYGRVPIVVFRNNEEEIGDFEPVKYLIDAYDVLLSDSMNEFDRFAWAYLVLKNLRMDEDDVEDIKAQRILEVAADGAVEFLTKDIPHEFIKYMSDLIKDEIHKQSHVPDFLDKRTGDSISGVAISKLLYDFEFIAATKEAYFKEGLRDRLRMIDTILKMRDGQTGDVNEIDIVMERNIPHNDKENAEIMGLYQGMSIPQRMLIDNFAAFVDNAEDAIKEYKEEQGESIDLDSSEEFTTESKSGGGQDDDGSGTTGSK